MRSAYGQDNAKPPSRRSTLGSEKSDGEPCSVSHSSYGTQPKSYSGSSSKRPSQTYEETYDLLREEQQHHYFEERDLQESPRSSVESYASTIASEQELLEELPQDDLPVHATNLSKASPIPASPSDFSQLFPSRRRLAIRHDDSTLDGDMNLRVDTKVPMAEGAADITLFHLRLHNLKDREFSLRRYCRDSGREVCHSTRKSQNVTPSQRPTLQRSLSDALQSIRPKSERRTSGRAASAGLRRNDSGYDSMHSATFDEECRPMSSSHEIHAEQPRSTNTIKLEFSNYAQVFVKRMGISGAKRYEFQYWGIQYAWKRVAQKNGNDKRIAYHLLQSGSDAVLAYIVPGRLTASDLEEERRKGGWIPPCSMWMADDHLIRSAKDVSDVVVASGLIALVDDSIRARFPEENARQLLIPVPKISVEYVGPKRLLSEMFNKTDRSRDHQSRPSSSGRPSTSGSGTRTTHTPTAFIRQRSYDR